MADVFVSYKREERELVQKLAGALRGLGLTVWFDASLSAGDAFSDEIDREARAAQVILVCWSPNARESRWVKSEALIGFERDVLAACYVAGPDRFSPQAPFNSVHTEDIRAWLEGGAATDARWCSLLRRIGSLTGRADIESFGDISDRTGLVELGKWLETHKNSPLFLVVENIYRVRVAEEEARESREREARARFDAEQAQRLAREAAAAREAERQRLETEEAKRKEAEEALRKAEAERKEQKARADRAEAVAKARLNPAPRARIRTESESALRMFFSIFVTNCIAALPATTFFASFFLFMADALRGNEALQFAASHVQLYRIGQFDFPGGGKGWFSGVSGSEWLLIVLLCHGFYFVGSVTPWAFDRAFELRRFKLPMQVLLGTWCAVILGLGAFVVAVVLSESFFSGAFFILLLVFVFGGGFTSLRGVFTGRADFLTPSPAATRWLAGSWLIAWPIGYFVVQILVLAFPGRLSGVA